MFLGSPIAALVLSSLIYDLGEGTTAERYTRIVSSVTMPVWLIVTACMIARMNRYVYPAQGRCGQCGYSRSGLPAKARCPECGAEP